MPEFPGQIRHSNQAYPVIDLTDEGTQFNQTGKSPVRGIGVFGSIDSRSAVTTRYRTKGYLAVVGSTPYVYTSSSTATADWETEGNWAGLAATNGLPSGGSLNNVLAKTSNDDYLADWTGDPKFSSLSLQKQDHPQLNFLSTQDAATADGTVLGRIEANGVRSAGSNAAAVGPKIDFTQVGAAGATGVGGKIEFFTSTSDGNQEVALTLNEEKTTIFASHSTEPTPYSGGMYYNTNTDSFYLGVES